MMRAQMHWGLTALGITIDFVAHYIVDKNNRVSYLH